MGEMNKKPYEKPQLQKHQQLKEVTLSSVGGSDGDNGGGKGKGKGND